MLTLQNTSMCARMHTRAHKRAARVNEWKRTARAFLCFLWCAKAMSISLTNWIPDWPCGVWFCVWVCVFYEHLLSVKILKGVKGVAPRPPSSGRYKSMATKTQKEVFECMDKWGGGWRKRRKEWDKSVRKKGERMKQDVKKNSGTAAVLKCVIFKYFCCRRA